MKKERIISRRRRCVEINFLFRERLGESFGLTTKFIFYEEDHPIAEVYIIGEE